MSCLRVKSSQTTISQRLKLKRLRIASLLYYRSASTAIGPRKPGSFMDFIQLGALLTVCRVYPERLLIYHAGIGRTVFLGSTKITTLFLFAFSTLFIAPAYYFSPDEPNWAAVAVAAGGAVPLVFVAYTTAPFVNYVHIRLPLFARQSQEHLVRWSKNISPSTEIDMTTMRLYGLPRVSRMPLADLQERKRTVLGVANLVRVPAGLGSTEKRPWWMGKEVTHFYVGQEKRTRTEPAIWPSVLDAIRKRKVS
ncbi:hypothetical protein MMC13_000590 [Lambiella insularis]|nr:hypothetical protein [Lambiella insularis]